MQLSYFNSPVLKKKSDDFLFDSNISDLVCNMFYIMYNCDGVGLAAPQVGKNVNIFVVDSREEGSTPYLFINPRIKVSGNFVSMEEGCLSYPGAWVNVNRNDEVEVFYKNILNKDSYLKTSGWLSRIIQHENDHLLGKTLGDKLSKTEKTILASKPKKKFVEKMSREEVYEKVKHLLGVL